MKHCTNCGKVLEDEALFCSACGKSTNQNVAKKHDSFHIDAVKVHTKVKSFVVRSNEPNLSEIKDLLEVRYRTQLSMRYANYLNRTYNGSSFKIWRYAEKSFRVLEKLLREMGYTMNVESQGSNNITYIVSR